MPIYSFTCLSCKHTIDKILKPSDPTKEIECPKCKGKSVRIISRTAPPKFNGPGWTERFH